MSLIESYCEMLRLKLGYAEDKAEHLAYDGCSECLEHWTDQANRLRAELAVVQATELANLPKDCTPTTPKEGDA